MGGGNLLSPSSQQLRVSQWSSEYGRNVNGPLVGIHATDYAVQHCTRAVQALLRKGSGYEKKCEEVCWCGLVRLRQRACHSLSLAQPRACWLWLVYHQWPWRGNILLPRCILCIRRRVRRRVDLSTDFPNPITRGRYFSYNGGKKGGVAAGKAAFHRSATWVMLRDWREGGGLTGRGKYSQHGPGSVYPVPGYDGDMPVQLWRAVVCLYVPSVILFGR